MEAWQKLLLAAGGAAGVASFLCYLLGEESEAELLAANGGGVDTLEQGNARRGGSLQKDSIVELLSEMVEAQEKIRVTTRAMAKDLAANPDVPMDELIKKVKDNTPVDPLEARGLEPNVFEQMLSTAFADPAVSSDMQVQMLLGKLMGQAPPTAVLSEKAKSLTVDDIIKMHEFMVEVLGDVSKGIKDKCSDTDGKTTVMVAQVVMDGKRLAKFGCTSEDMEAAIMKNQAALQKDKGFMDIAMKFQQAMQGLAMPSAPGSKPDLD